MICKFLYQSFQKSKLRRAHAIVILFSSTCAVGQSHTIPYPNDAAKQRLLIEITAHYIYTVSQGQIDMDSAIRIPCRVYELSPLLAYNEGYSDGKPSPGSTLLDEGRVKEANALLSSQLGEARLQLLLELATYFIFKPGTEKADLTLASRYVNQAVAESKSLSNKWRIESLIVKANFLDQSGLSDESQTMLAEAAQLCQQTENKLSLGRVLLIAGKLLPYGHRDRLSNFEKANTIFNVSGAKEKEVEALSEITVQHFAFKRYKQAKESALKTIEIENEIGFRQLQYAYDALSFMALQTGDPVNAIAYSNKSLASVLTKQDSVFISLFHHRIADLYFSISKDEEAAAALDKALENRSHATRLYWYKAFLSKVRLLTTQNKLEEAFAEFEETGRRFPAISVFEKLYFANAIGQAYEKQNKLQLAEQNYKVFLSLADNFPIEYIHNEFPSAFSTISSFYQRIGQTGKARELLNRAKPILFSLGTGGKTQYYTYLFAIDSSENKYLDAIRDLQLSARFMDSTLSHDAKKNVDELLVKYETEKKDKDIQLLKQQGELQEARLQQFQLGQRVTFVGTGLLLVIAGLLYYLYRTKQKTNTQLRHLLTEKDWLLKEVHHRVKNNLQTVLSLLESQSRRQLSHEALHAIQESQNRVYAMSLIHKKLYQSTDVASINMEDYLHDLIDHLRESFGNSESIEISIELEPIHLDVSQAVPIGLIVNEAFTNSLKYAFPENRNDHKILISLKTENNKINLLIGDNGVGMKEDQIGKSQNLGLKLMKGLTEDIDGFFKVATDNGVTIRIQFVPNVPLQRAYAEVSQAPEIQPA